MNHTLKILILAVLCSAFSVYAGARNTPERDSLWNGAVAAYTAEDYETALAGFLALENDGIRSADLYYDIANTYFKRGNSTGKAILYYERALRMNPSFDDASHNLKLARAQALDKIDVVPEFVVITWLKYARDSFSSNEWAVGCILFFILTLVSIFFFRFGRTAGTVKLSFAIGILALLLTAFCFGCALSIKNESERTDRGVVMTPVSSGKSSPNDNGQSLFIIHEGTDVSIIEELGEWTRVELTDGRQGWIRSTDLEII